MKKLVSKETIAEVNAMLKQSDVIFEPCDISGGFCVRLGNIVIRKVGTSSIIELDPSVKKDLFGLWKKDVGKYLSRDLSHGVYSNLFELMGSGKKVLLRKAPQNELAEIRAEGFDHLYIGDYHYTIIRVIPINGKYSDPDENTEEEDYTQYSYISEYDSNDKVTEEEEIQQGMALFTEDDITSGSIQEPILDLDSMAAESYDEE